MDENLILYDKTDDPAMTKPNQHSLKVIQVLSTCIADQALLSQVPIKLQQISWFTQDFAYINMSGPIEVRK